MPDAEYSALRYAVSPARVPSGRLAVSFTLAVEPLASAICEATVRFQISS